MYVYACGQIQVFAWVWGSPTPFYRALEFLDILQLLRSFPQGFTVVKAFGLERGCRRIRGREGLWGSSLDWERMSKDFSLLLTSLIVSSFRRKGLRGR